MFFFGREFLWPSIEAEGEGPHIVMAIIRQFVERGTVEALKPRFLTVLEVD